MALSTLLMLGVAAALLGPGLGVAWAVFWFASRSILRLAQRRKSFNRPEPLNVSG